MIIRLIHFRSKLSANAFGKNAFCDEIGSTPRKEHNIPKCETRQIPKIPAQDRVSCSLGKLVCPESRATYRSTAIFLFPTLGISRRGTRALRNLTDFLSRLFIFETKWRDNNNRDGVHGRKPSQSDRLIPYFARSWKYQTTEEFQDGIAGRSSFSDIGTTGEGTCRSIDLSRLSFPESVKFGR